MKLSDKIEKLEIAVRRLNHLHMLCDDIEIINMGEADYYCSQKIMQTSPYVEFLTPKSTFNAIHKASIYYDFYIEESAIRVYDKLLEIKLFIVQSEDSNFQCYNYSKQLDDLNINPIALRKMHMYVVDFMKKTNISVNKKSLPDSIKNLLAFI